MFENLNDKQLADFLRELSIKCLNWKNGTIEVTPSLLIEIADRLEARNK